MPNPIVHFEVVSEDTMTIREFYSKLLGWTIAVPEGSPMDYGMAMTKDNDQGIDGGFYQVDDPDDRPGIRIYAQVADADAVLAQADSLGGKSLGPSQEVPGMGIKVGQFLDPEGNIFGVVQPLGPG